MSNNMGGAPLIPTEYFCKNPECKTKTIKRISGLCHDCQAKFDRAKPPTYEKKPFDQPLQKYKGWKLRTTTKIDMARNKRTLEELRKKGVMYIAKDGELKRGVYP